MTLSLTSAVCLLAVFAMREVSLANTQPKVQTTVACSATAYMNDPDPKGMHVRSAADSKSTIVATITDSDSELEITGSSGDWLRVRNIHSIEGTALFKGEGWVFASLTATRAKGAATLRVAPDKSSAAVTKLRDEDQLTIIGCKGEWLQVKRAKVTGWIDKVSRCSNPVTTCA